MKGKFVIVFSDSDKQKLESYGYQFVTFDKRNNFYIFKNMENGCATFDSINMVYTDILTF